MKMSVWTHVAGIIRWDSMGWMVGKPWLPFVKRAFVAPPEGSEGPLVVQFRHDPESADAKCGSGSLNCSDVTILSYYGEGWETVVIPGKVTA
jgi:hypothetical protein